MSYTCSYLRACITYNILSSHHQECNKLLTHSSQNFYEENPIVVPLISYKTEIE